MGEQCGSLLGVDTSPHFNRQTGVYTRVRPDGLLHIVGALPRPDDPEPQPAGLWLSALVDERPTDPHIVEVTVSERPPVDANADEPSKWVVAEGQLEPGERPARITANVLRQAPLGQVHEVLDERRGGTARAVAGAIPNPTEMADHDDRYYAAWAAHYVTTATSSRRPVADIADRFGVSRDSVRDRLNTARGRGMLTRGSHGRAGGQLTDKALEALGREEG
jgi:hypothetical protein